MCQQGKVVTMDDDDLVVTEVVHKVGIDLGLWKRGKKMKTALFCSICR